MMEEIVEKASGWLQNESASRTLAMAGTVAVAALTALWTRLRRKPPPERVDVYVNAPPGERVVVDIGRKSEL